jgi:predicted transcriptional regulator
MKSLSDKNIAIETIRKLPSNASLKDIRERLAYIEAVRKGLDQLERGETVSLENVKKKIAKWASKSS